MRDELEIVNIMRKRYKASSLSLIRSIGDDAAVVKNDNKYYLYTTDFMVEDVHFSLKFETPYQIGFRLVSSNVSDIFAMGGEPEFMLLNIALKSILSQGFLDELMDGIEEGLKRYGLSLIGGDLSESKNTLFVGATMMGYSRRPILRDGAKPGDRIYITGTLGDSRAGLELLKSIKRPLNIRLNGMNLTREDEEILKSFNPKIGSILYLMRRHLLPEPRPIHNTIKNIHSMIDVSDGLLIDLWRLCTESKVGADIYEERIPLSYELSEVSAVSGFNALDFAYKGGEDYELLFTTSEEIDPSILSKMRITEIGMITEKGFNIIEKGGGQRPFIPEGFLHLRKHDG